MSCTTMHERMMDVLYGEELSPERCLEFFRHLESCPDCKAEYLELVETRSLLAQWDLGQAVPEAGAVTGGKVRRLLRRIDRSPAWRTVYKAAACILILLGMTVIARDLGWAERATLEVSRQELETMINDVTIARQEEERRLIGQYVIQVRDDLERDMGQIHQYLQVVDLQQKDAQEDYRAVRALLTR